MNSKLLKLNNTINLHLYEASADKTDIKNLETNGVSDVTDVLSIAKTNEENNESTQDATKLDPSTQNTVKKKETGNNSIDGFYDFMQGEFNKELVKIDNSIAAVFKENTEEVEKNISRYKDAHPSKPSTHFEIFNDINEKYFKNDSNTRQAVSLKVVEYCKETNGVTDLIFKNSNSEQEMENAIYAVLHPTEKNKDVSDSCYKRTIMVMKHILFKQYKNSVDKIIKKQQESDPDLPPSFVKKTINDCVASVERVLISDNNTSDNYIVSDESYMKSDEVNHIWREFIRNLEQDAPINEWDNCILNAYRFIANRLDSENDTQKVKEQKLKIYKSYSKYRKLYDKLDKYLNGSLVNPDFKNNILNDSFIEELKKETEDRKRKRWFDIFSKKVIEKIYGPENISEQKIIEAENGKKEEKSKTQRTTSNLSKENYEWFIQSLNEALKEYYKSAEVLSKGLPKEKKEEEKKKDDTIAPSKDNTKIENTKTGEESIENFINAFLSYINTALLEENGKNKRYSQYICFGLLEKFKAIFQVEYLKKTGGLIELSKEDHLNNFYKLMGRYPRQDDLKEYQETYKRVKENVDVISEMISSVKKSLSDRMFYEPMDYIVRYMGGYFFRIGPDSDPVLTVESDSSYGDYAKEFLNKCFAYKELSLLAKEYKKEDNGLKSKEGSSIAKEIVGETEITNEDIQKMFVCIHLANENISMDFRSMMFLIPDFKEKYIVGQPYNMSRLTKQNYVSIFTANDKQFVGTLDFVSYSKLRSMLKQFGNFSNFINDIGSRTKPKLAI